VESIASIERGSRGGLPCIQVTGEIDASNIKLFEAALRTVLTETLIGVEVDLRAVTFFGSEAIGALVAADLLAGDLGVGMTVVPSQVVRRVLEVTGLDGVLNIAPRNRDGELPSQGRDGPRR
jgi:anti-anti-sigma factor